MTITNNTLCQCKLNDWNIIKEREMLRPYTMDEINAVIDNAERESAAGEYRTNEEVFKGLLSEDELNLRNYEQEGCLA